MTGGAGFSKNSSDSFRENRNLGKVRSRNKASSSSKRTESNKPEDLEENLEFLNTKREKERRLRWLIPVLFILAFILVMALATF